MNMKVTVEGADDLIAALLELPKRATQKAVVRRALTQAAQPIRDLASALAPYDPADPAPHLRDSIIVSGSTASRQKDPGAAPGAVIVYIGPTRTATHRHDIEMEFGTFKDRPQPYMRPAWEARKDQAFDQIGFFMWSEIDGAAQRLAAKAARAGG